MQSATGQYGSQAGDPAQPVQHSVMTASSFGFFFRGVVIPSDFGSLLTTVAVMLELCHIERWVRLEGCLTAFAVIAAERAASDTAHLTKSLSTKCGVGGFAFPLELHDGLTHFGSPP